MKIKVSYYRSPYFTMEIVSDYTLHTQLKENKKEPHDLKFPHISIIPEIFTPKSFR